MLTEALCLVFQGYLTYHGEVEFTLNPRRGQMLFLFLRKITMLSLIIIDNYRPVSLLSCVGKLVQRSVFKYVVNFLMDTNAISLKQSGVMPGDSTVYHVGTLASCSLKLLTSTRVYEQYSEI